MSKSWWIIWDLQTLEENTFHIYEDYKGFYRPLFRLILRTSIKNLRCSYLAILISRSRRHNKKKWECQVLWLVLILILRLLNLRNFLLLTLFVAWGLYEREYFTQILLLKFRHLILSSVVVNLKLEGPYIEIIAVEKYGQPMNHHHEPNNTKWTCWKLHRKNQKPHLAHIANASALPNLYWEQTLLFLWINILSWHNTKNLWRIRLSLSLPCWVGNTIQDFSSLPHNG